MHGIVYKFKILITRDKIFHIINHTSLLLYITEKQILFEYLRQNQLVLWGLAEFLERSNRNLNSNVISEWPTEARADPTRLTEFMRAIGNNVSININSSETGSEWTRSIQRELAFANPLWLIARWSCRGCARFSASNFSSMVARFSSGKNAL